MSVSSPFLQETPVSPCSSHRTSLQRSICAGLVALTLSSCVSIEEFQGHLLDYRKLEERLDAAEKKIDLDNNNIRSIVMHAFCPPAIGALVRKVKKVCQQEQTGICKGESVSLALLSVDPSNRGHFLTLARTQPHVAFYFRADQEALSDSQRKDLRALLTPPWFEQTHFLVVASPDPQESAEMSNGVARLYKIVTEIKATKFPNEDNVDGYVSPVVPEGKILKWVFPFVNRSERIDAKDAPKNSSETLYRSVWVFRVDCDT